MDRKSQFQRDWLDANWDKFVNDGIEDSHGRLITVADALADALAELTYSEIAFINAAFATDDKRLHVTAEVIAKSYLLETVASELWNNHLADLEDEQ